MTSIVLTCTLQGIAKYLSTSERNHILSTMQLISNIGTARISIKDANGGAFTTCLLNHIPHLDVANDILTMDAVSAWHACRRGTSVSTRDPNVRYGIIVISDSLILERMVVLRSLWWE